MDADGIKTGAMDVDCKDSASKFGDRRFGQPVSDDEIFKLIKDQENVNTKNNTKWAMHLFEKWQANGRENIPDFKLMTTEKMSFWLGRFVMEAEARWNIISGKIYLPYTVRTFPIFERQWCL